MRIVERPYICADSDAEVKHFLACIIVVAHDHTRITPIVLAVDHVNSTKSCICGGGGDCIVCDGAAWRANDHDIGTSVHLETIVNTASITLDTKDPNAILVAARNQATSRVSGGNLDSGTSGIGRIALGRNILFGSCEDNGVREEKSCARAQLNDVSSSSG